MGRTFKSFDVSFLTSDTLGFFNIILKNENFKTRIKRARHKSLSFHNNSQYSRYGFLLQSLHICQSITTNVVLVL